MGQLKRDTVPGGDETKSHVCHGKRREARFMRTGDILDVCNFRIITRYTFFPKIKVLQIVLMARCQGRVLPAFV